MKFLIKKNIYFINAATKLLGSGIISSIGIIFFSSNTIEFIDTNTIVDLLIVIQLHSVGLTITKLSYDTISYSHFLNNKNNRPNIKKFLFDKSVILAMPILIFAIYRFNYVVGFFVFINIILDQFSNLVINQLNFRHLFNKAFLLNLLSYPLFFITIIALSYCSHLLLEIHVLIFFICLVLKFVLADYFYKRIYYSADIDISPSWSMGFQQVLNYILFKSDTILISLPLIIISTLSINKSEILEILYLSRFPELVSGVTLSLSVLFYPRYVVNGGTDFINKIKFKDFSFYIFFIFLGYAVFLLFWRRSDDLKIYNIIFYFFNGLFVVFCNLITFNLIKKEKFKLLLNNLLLSCVLGVISLVFFKLTSLNFYFAVVPIQMILFIFCFLLYDKAPLDKSHAKHY